MAMECFGTADLDIFKKNNGIISRTSVHAVFMKWLINWLSPIGRWFDSLQQDMDKFPYSFEDSSLSLEINPVIELAEKNFDRKEQEH